MATQRKAILDAIKTALAATAGVDPDHVWRSFTGSVHQSEMPAINIQPETGDPSEPTTGGTDENLAVLIEVHACGDVPDDAADPVVESVHALLMADTTLGGLCFDITEAGTSWDFDDGDQPACKVSMRFRVWHRHPRESL